MLQYLFYALLPIHSLQTRETQGAHHFSECESIVVKVINNHYLRTAIIRKRAEVDGDHLALRMPQIIKVNLVLFREIIIKR
jgi:hypothetical protein